MTLTRDNINIENNLTMSSFSPNFTKQATSLNGTYVLTITSNFVNEFTGTATGYKIQLPNANTLTNGWKYEFYNSSSQAITIVYNDGTTFATEVSSSFVSLTLEDNSTTNGSWLRWGAFTGGTASGILNYSVSSSTPFTLSTGTADTLITGMSITPVSGTYCTLYQGSIQITGNNTNVRTTIYSAGTIVTESLRTIQSSVSTFNTTHITSSITQFSGTDLMEIRVARDSNTLTVNSRSVIMFRLSD
jgi:hypothetical protein